MKANGSARFNERDMQFLLPGNRLIDYIDIFIFIRFLKSLLKYYFIHCLFRRVITSSKIKLFRNTPGKFSGLISNQSESFRNLYQNQCVSIRKKCPISSLNQSATSIPMYPNQSFNSNQSQL